jgi:hypothetical protein
MSEATVTKALVVLSEWGLVRSDGSAWKCCCPSLNRSTGDLEVYANIRSALLAYRPFESICEGLAAGETFDRAARHTAVALCLDARSEEKLALLRQWAVELGVLTDGAHGPSLSPDLKGTIESHAALPVDSMTSTSETRLYICALLGRDAFDQLDEVDRGLLVTAVAECDSNPANSVEASGQALEDYLRELCMARGIGNDASKRNGASQLGALLRQNNLIHSHHVKLVDAASMLRNAKAHKKDKQTVTPWSITQLGARTAFGTTALAVRSIHEWITNGGQSL